MVKYSDNIYIFEHAEVELQSGGNNKNLYCNHISNATKNEQDY